MGVCQSKSSLDEKPQDTGSQRDQHKQIMKDIDALMHKNPAQILAPNTIKKIIRLYKLWNSYHTETRTTTVARRILYYIAPRMFWSKFPESETVVQLLHWIFETDKDFYSILFPDQFIPPVHNNRQHDFVGYFLSHSLKLQATFDGYRMDCRPVFCVPPYSWVWPFKLAARKANPLLLFQLLSHGSFLSLSSSISSRIITQIPNWCIGEALRSTVLSIVTSNPQLLPYEEARGTLDDPDLYLRRVSCLDLLLKDYPRLGIDFLAESKFELHCSGVMDAIGFAKKFSANIFPDFEKYFLSPFDLKHSCRLVIRRSLNSRGFLPRGICCLKIPRSLKLYLDLKDN